MRTTGAKEPAIDLTGPSRTLLTTTAGIGWHLAPVTGSVVPVEVPEAGWPAPVPGEVHPTLLAAGVVPDPFDGDHETAVAWVGRTDWVWSATFAWSGDREVRHDLVIAHPDTVAAIVLNGVEVGRTANQHRTYRFDVGQGLRDGDNDLVITIEGPYAAAERLETALGPRPRGYPHPYNAVRKMASAFGWDWGPDLAGAGLLGDVALESWAGVRVAAVRPQTWWRDGSAGLVVEVDLDWADAPAATLEIGCAGGRVQVEVENGTTPVRVEIPVGRAEAWWPRGYGPQPRYDLAVALDGEPVWERKVGFRSVTLSTEPDMHGTEFVLAVNGSPVYVKGANWIPDDAFLSRLDADTYRSSLTDAYDAGMNLLRVWGGGSYEREEFYDLCDELGLLVWQDFLFACAAYSEEPPLADEVAAEAREAITRLSAHPSLALWNGNNENIWGYVDWGWRPELAGASWGDGYYTEVLPALVAELAPGTPYSPGSPFSFAPYHHPNAPRHGTTHLWEVWNARDYDEYAADEPRFVSEFGFQGPPAWSTLTSVVHDEPLDPYGRQMLVHQKAEDGNLKLERGLGRHLPHWPVVGGVVDMDDWHWTTQLNQARAVAFGIHHFRALFPVNTGAIVWQLNDNWPVVSWSAVDAHGIRKPLWFALRAAYADRLPIIDLVAGRLTLHNDTGSVWSTALRIGRQGTGPGSPVLAEQAVRVEIGPRSSLAIALADDVRHPGDPARELVTVRAAGLPTAFGYFVEDTELALLAPTEAYAVTVDGPQVTVTAADLVKDLALFPDRLDPSARVDSGLVTLLAGESHRFTVIGAVGLDPDALGARPVLRSVNDLVTRDRRGA